VGTGSLLKYTNNPLHKIWCIIGILVILFLPSYLAWRTLEFWKVREEAIMSFLILTLYLLTFLITSKTTIFPRIEHAGVIFTVVSLMYLILISIIAIGRLYYSRSFLLYAYILNFIWLMIGYLLKRKRKPKLMLLTSADCDNLLAIENIAWYIPNSPSEDPLLDGIVISSLEELDSAWLRYVVNQALKGASVYHISDIYEAYLGKLPFKYFSEEFIGDNYRSFTVKFSKRSFDVILALVLSPLTLLLSIVIAILIKLDSEGPVFFKQDRVGQGGKVFKMIKFRTMYVDAEAKGPKFADKDDPRITRIGRILRKFHLDELPQIWNILKGEMSFIGPRPEQTKFVEEFEREIPYYNLRHLVKPGITGWAQIHYGYAAGLEETIEKLEYDLYYIKNMSVWLDLVIILKTILVLLRRQGAR
jgi:lipopolysaccharide/colanic/teichoic acid biosynthesis glycosyltransferase